MSSGVKFNVIDFLKLAPKYFLPLLLFSAIIIFVPNNWLGFLSLEEIVAKHKWVFSLIFIFSTSMFVSGILIKGFDEIKNKIKNRRISKTIKNKLKNLSETQKNILLQFVEDDVKSVQLPFASGEVIELTRYLIIYRASQISTDVGEGGYYFDYCLQPLAEEIITKNPRLLKRGRKMTN